MDIYILEKWKVEMAVNQNVDRHYSKDWILYLEKKDQTDAVPHINIDRFIIKN